MPSTTAQVTPQVTSSNSNNTVNKIFSKAKFNGDLEFRRKNTNFALFPTKKRENWHL